MKNKTLPKNTLAAGNTPPGIREISLIYSGEAKDEQLARDCIHYNLTGEINDRLLVGFNQHGQWDGLFQQDGQEFDRSLTRLLSGLLIPKNRLTKIGEKGEITLLSSYFLDHEGPLTVDYHRVEGDVSALNITAFHAPHLELVRGCLCLDYIRQFDAPNLRFVGRRLNAWGLKKFSAPQLQIVGENLNCQSAIEFAAPKLSCVKGLHVGSAKNIQLPLLRVVDGDFDGTCAKELHVPHLMFVGGDLHAGKVLNLRVPCLRFVNGSLDAPKAKQFHAPVLESIEQNLDVKNAKDIFAPSLKWWGEISMVSSNFPKRKQFKSKVLRKCHS